MSPANQISPAEIRPTVARIDLSALSHNFSAIKCKAGRAKIMAVVKANAYGHGLTACAEKFVQCGADYLGVACVEEGLELRRAGLTCPILVFGGLYNQQIELFLRHNLEITASSVAKLQFIDQAAAAHKIKAKVHLKVDTGMERIGIHYFSAEQIFEAALSCKNCEIVGVYSHFASSDDETLEYSHLQLERFQNALEFFAKRSLPLPLRHIANSAALLRLPESCLDMVRPGLALYGAYPSAHVPRDVTLKPALSLVSRIVYFKVVKKDSGVSYNHTWVAPHDSRVVTIPIGYGDGFPRLLSNKGRALIRGKSYPLVGNICMDQSMISLGSNGEGYNGDEVVLIGTQGNESISVDELAEKVKTISYEILTSMNLRIPREYHGG